MTHAIKDIIHMPHGLDIDLDEGWRKLVSRQFGQPGRGFSELIQNFLDSYPASVPWAERRGEIDSGPRWISITDYGEGLSARRVELLLTLGGTDKRNDANKIGQFGIGFYAIFGEKLGTRRVTVTSRCEGVPIEIVFRITDPGRRPTISIRELDEPIEYSTRIHAELGSHRAVEQCLQFARGSLKYYPCRVSLNGEPFVSVWGRAAERGLPVFEEGPCRGFIDRAFEQPRVELLCKFEHLMTLSVGMLSTGGHGLKWNLSDYQRRGIPFVPHTRTTINCNALRVTISRDSFSMDRAYERMVEVLARQLGEHLVGQLPVADDERNASLIAANQYVLRTQIASWIKAAASPDEKTLPEGKVGGAVLRRLAEAKIYRLSGKAGRVSLLDVARLRTSDLPVFYSPGERNMRWLGGGFKHDFVVIPPRVSAGGGAPDLWDNLLRAVLSDVVDLTTVAGDAEVLRRLVEKGVVDADQLAPKTRIVTELEVSEELQALRAEIDELLSHDVVLRAVRANLKIPAATIRVAYFDVEGDTVQAPAGLFDGDTAVAAERPPDATDALLLGLRVDHALVQHLGATENPLRAYFTLTWLGHELARSQKALVPHSRLDGLVKASLARDLRTGLVAHLLAKRHETGEVAPSEAQA